MSRLMKPDSQEIQTAISSFSCHGSHQVEKGKKLWQEETAEWSYSCNVRVGGTLKIHAVEELFLHTLINCRKLQPLSTRQFLQFLNGSDVTSFSLWIPSAGPGSALSTIRKSPVPLPYDSYRGLPSPLFLPLCSQLLQPDSHGMGLRLFAILMGFSRDSWFIFIPGCHIKKNKLNFYYTVESKYHFRISKYYHWSI